MGGNMRIKIILVLIAKFFGFTKTEAGKFASNYPCTDSVKTCVSSGTRTIDGFQVHKDCWEWAYIKTCKYPSKNDCKNYSHCYAVADLPCLLRDSYGNCINLQKEFSCKRWEPAIIHKEVARIALKETHGKVKLVCKGVACFDGNCVDKSYLTDGDMMDSISKLYMVSQMKDAIDLNFRIFGGFGDHCSKKATLYTNCCTTSLKGWGTNLGAKCSKDEKDLIDKRQKNRCVYVGKENKQTMGVTTIVKHHWCCFGSLFNKVVQLQARKQLGISFGSGGKTDCRGLTLQEIMNLDFSKMDFSEFFVDIVKQMKIPNVGDISARVNGSLPNVRKYDGNPNNKKNNMSGWHANIQDESWEAEEERRTEAERIRLVEEEKEAKRLALVAEEAKRKRKIAKELEKENLLKLCAQDYNEMKSIESILASKLAGLYPAGSRVDSFRGIVDSTQTKVIANFDQMEAKCKHIPEIRRMRNLHGDYVRNRDKAGEISNEIKSGNY
jgi:conjugal transfer mating pair stabilization protein TraN